MPIAASSAPQAATRTSRTATSLLCSFSSFRFPCSRSESLSPSFLQVTVVATALMELPRRSSTSFRARSGRGPLDLAASAMNRPSLASCACRRFPASPGAACVSPPLCVSSASSGSSGTSTPPRVDRAFVSGRPSCTMPLRGRFLIGPPLHPVGLAHGGQPSSSSSCPMLVPITSRL
ncbi:uncharacterized protein LOC125556588 [Triticum urartu]|uniref:uncharacterized protein LOC125556588 n=1 Tax=Triticum urartu TaxID=4572 RepID=UPI002044651F|nr:uncharacterized protein LOC125556588 [Triticum urartu]